MTSRRKFLRETFFGAVFLSAARFFPDSLSAGTSSEDSPSDLRYFSPYEYVVMQAIAVRIVGEPGPGEPGARDVNVALRADHFLATADVEMQEQFHQLLTVFNAPFFTFLFDLRFSSFVAMAPEDQDSYLEDWMTSNLGFRRTGFQALKRISLSMFYTESTTWKEIGYEGMFMPGDRR